MVEITNKLILLLILLLL